MHACVVRAQVINWQHLVASYYNSSMFSIQGLQPSQSCEWADQLPTLVSSREVCTLYSVMAPEWAWITAPLFVWGLWVLSILWWYLRYPTLVVHRCSLPGCDLPLCSHAEWTIFHSAVTACSTRGWVYLQLGSHDLLNHSNFTSK
jgi:hypothetical protein